MQKNHCQLYQTANLLFCIALCAIGGHLLASLVVDKIIFNTDTAAPFYQAKLITQGITIDPKILSFARIPSIFPDLATLISLTKADPNAGFHIIVARYSWAIASSLIFLQAEFCILTLSKLITRMQAITIASIITIGLVAINPQFKEAIGLILTPLHHGGNIINTYIIGCVALYWLGRHNSQREATFYFKLLLSAIAISLGAASNKLLFFTAIIPATTTAALSFLLVINRGKLEPFFKPIKRRYKLLVLFASAILTGFAIPSLINVQCSLPIIIRPLETYPKLFLIAVGNISTILGLVLAIVLLLFSFFSFQKCLRDNTATFKEFSKINIKKQFFMGSCFLCISTFSPLGYTWLLGEPQHFPLRYVIIMITGISTTSIIIASLLTHKIEAFLQQRKFSKAKILIYLVLGALSLPRAFSEISKGRIETIYTNNFSSRKHDLANLTAKLNSIGLTHGLSDYWGTELEFISDLSYTNGKKITIEPILNNGEPDFWAHNKYQFMDISGQINKYNFVVSLNREFDESVTKAYGKPEILLRTPNSPTSILIYSNSFKKQKIHNILLSKAVGFDRQCNQAKPNFNDR